MQTKIEELGSCKKKLSIEVSLEDITLELEKEFEKIQENAILPGFRKGRAPRNLLEKRFKKHIEEEVKQNIITNSYQQAIEENKLTPLGMPEFGDINFDITKPLNYDITLEVKPDFETKDYKGIEIKKSEIEISDKLVNDELKHIGRQKSTLQAVKGGQVKKEDIVICDLKVEVDGEAALLEEGLEVHVSSQIIGSLKAPDLEKTLVGTKSGQSTSFVIKLEGDFPEKFREKDANVTIKVNDIKRLATPTIDDEFAKQFDFDSLDEFKDKIKQNLEARAKIGEKQNIIKQISVKLIENANFELPAGLINHMANERIEKYKTALLNQGEDLNKVEEQAKKLKDISEDTAKNELRLTLILENIANKEKIYVTDTEVDRRIAEFARNYNITPEKMQRYIEKMDNISSIRRELRETKTIDFLIKEAKILDGTQAKENKGS